MGDAHLAAVKPGLLHMLQQLRQRLAVAPALVQLLQGALGAGCAHNADAQHAHGSGGDLAHPSVLRHIVQGLQGEQQPGVVHIFPGLGFHLLKGQPLGGQLLELFQNQPQFRAGAQAVEHGHLCPGMLLQIQLPGSHGCIVRAGQGAGDGNGVNFIPAVKGGQPAVHAGAGGVGAPPVRGQSIQHLADIQRLVIHKMHMVCGDNKGNILYLSPGDGGAVG